MEIGVGGTMDLELMARVVVVAVEGGEGIIVEKGGWLGWGSSGGVEGQVREGRGDGLGLYIGSFFCSGHHVRHSQMRVLFRHPC
jgi:hypothetical protein